MMRQFSFLPILLRRRNLAVLAVVLCVLIPIAMAREGAMLSKRYDALFSPTIVDRNGMIILRAPNDRGAYTREGTIPEELRSLILAKEDRWFYWHPGVNPWSVLRVSWQYANGDRSGGASTITQQLAKILLGNEQQRTLKNKLRETFSVAVLELFHSKRAILDMYAQTVYLGNGAQGFSEASVVYFGVPLEELSTDELFSLVTTLGSPSANNPASLKHDDYTKRIAETIGITYGGVVRNKTNRAPHGGNAEFELRSLHGSCPTRCESTIDQELMKKLRDALLTLTEESGELGATNAAIVVISIPENEILAMVGSPDPTKADSGAQINMALTPRPIGSTIKPLIYAESFAKGARPYSLVRDEEYRYTIASGFPLYPKNYDGKYRGEVTLAEALANSLNVPAVKVLEFVGQREFNDLLTRRYGFTPIAPLEGYGYGIALGGLEADLTTLTHMLSPFAAAGMISPLRLWRDESGGTADSLPSMTRITETTRIFSAADVGLVNTILTDRTLGVEQFGEHGTLNIPGSVVAVKTGTSRDYHDSWTIGWTPDFIVGVWVGNAENTPLRQLSGSAGAGKLWNDAMRIMLNSSYNKRTTFTFPLREEFIGDRGIEYGLKGDDPTVHRSILLDSGLIRVPHDGDTFLFGTSLTIPFRASVPLEWSVNGKVIGKDTEIEWSPTSPGDYQIKAVSGDQIETITVHVVTN